MRACTDRRLSLDRHAERRSRRAEVRMTSEPPASTSNPFFSHPILNSPYEPPARHWELDKDGQPTQKISIGRRRAEFITPIPRPRKTTKAAKQEAIVFDEGKGLSTKEQQYDPTPVINEVRGHVAAWRSLPRPEQWGV